MDTSPRRMSNPSVQAFDLRRPSVTSCRSQPSERSIEEMLNEQMQAPLSLCHHDWSMKFRKIKRTKSSMSSSSQSVSSSCSDDFASFLQEEFFLLASKIYAQHDAVLKHSTCTCRSVTPDTSKQSRLRARLSTGFIGSQSASRRPSVSSLNQRTPRSDTKDSKASGFLPVACPGMTDNCPLSARSDHEVAQGVPIATHSSQSQSDVPHAGLLGSFRRQVTGQGEQMPSISVQQASDSKHHVTPTHSDATMHGAGSRKYHGRLALNELQPSANRVIREDHEVPDKAQSENSDSASDADVKSMKDKSGKLSVYESSESDHSQNEAYQTKPDKSVAFALHSTWKADINEPDAVRNSYMSLGFDSETSSEVEVEPLYDVDAGLGFQRLLCSTVKAVPRRLLIDPNSRAKVLWDFVAFLLVIYDCIMIPLSFFDVEISEVGWISRCFWSSDLVVSLLTTHVLQNGKLERSPMKVVVKKAKSWLLKDLPLVTIDWVDYIVGSAGAAKLGKIVKAIRIMRLLRLWRLINTKELPEGVKAAIQYYFLSEMSLTLLSILKLLCAVMWVNHVLACCWYGIAAQAGESRSWLQTNNLRDESDLYIYLTALHWSVTQFFCGGMEVVPTTVAERVFCVVVLFGTLMMSASIISSLTTSMTRLSIVAAGEAQQFALLAEYLAQNEISPRVALRVQRNARYALQEQKRHTSEQDVELLALVSQPLRIELHYEVHMPWLRKHPFFKHFGEQRPELMRKVCHAAISSLSISNGDLLFSQGVTNVQHMYFLITGKLLYSQTQIRDDIFAGRKRTSVLVGDWACEAVLWTSWSHFGSMRAKTESQLMMLTSEVFRTIASDFKSSLLFAGHYASSFVESLNTVPELELTDLAHPEVDSLQMVMASVTKQAMERQSIRRMSRVSDSDVVGPNLLSIQPVSNGLQKP